MKLGLLAVFAGLALISYRTFNQSAQALTLTAKHQEMKQFSLLVRVPETYSEAQVKSAGVQWNNLIEQWKAAGIYVLSFAFPGESYTVSGTGGKTVKKESVLSGNLRVVSQVVLRAASIEQALELAKSVPVLLYGGTVEVREIPKPIQPAG
ncbi:YciI family protein [Olivibacter sp. LS-1]|uniref:Uncharacterized protein n=1 Tax=Sphingobacterium sp. (strain 21) TaxID=743722 RepID=F4CBH5_SPHS2|nr:hypothetical protein [Olivibacter sp. LS-1]QEK99435.1 hypothetical protein FKG96_01030 [Olivibacter sp. LS-1]